MKKQIRKCLNFYLNNINSNEYREYVKMSEEEGRENHKQFIMENVPNWATRTDYYEDSVITQVIIGDVLSNDGIVKLLRKLYSMPKNKYRVRNRFKKPHIRNKYDYVRLQYTNSGLGSFAEIDFLKDKYVKRIEITWTQINNYFAYVEYVFVFHKCLDDTLYDSFIVDNIKKLTSKDYICWYYIHKEKQLRYMALNQMHSELFPTICQHYITTLLFSEQGSLFPLKCIIFKTRKDPIEIDNLYINDFGCAFYNREDKYIIIGDFGDDTYCLLSGNNRVPNFTLCVFMSDYGNEFYYKFFGKNELQKFEYEFSKYANGRVRAKYNKKITNLLSRMQSLSDCDFIESQNFYENFNKSWEFYVGNDKAELDDWFKDELIKFRNIYEKNFRHIKLLTEMNYTKSNYIVAIIATIASVVATVISLVAMFVNTST